jgi:hypothetical protein
MAGFLLDKQKLRLVGRGGILMGVVQMFTVRERTARALHRGRRDGGGCARHAQY